MAPAKVTRSVFSLCRQMPVRQSVLFTSSPLTNTRAPSSQAGPPPPPAGASGALEEQPRASATPTAAEPRPQRVVMERRISPALTPLLHPAREPRHDAPRVRADLPRVVATLLHREDGDPERAELSTDPPE